MGEIFKLNKEQFAELSGAIDNFYDWVDCECSECRGRTLAHATDLYRSTEKLIEYLKPKFLEESHE